MSRPIVTRILCPECEGTGVSPDSHFIEGCMCCGGSGRVPPKAATQFANALEWEAESAGGGAGWAAARFARARRVHAFVARCLRIEGGGA